MKNDTEEFIELVKKTKSFTKAYEIQHSKLNVKKGDFSEEQDEEETSEHNILGVSKNW